MNADVDINSLKHEERSERSSRMLLAQEDITSEPRSRGNGNPRSLLSWLKEAGTATDSGNDGQRGNDGCFGNIVLDLSWHAFTPVLFCRWRNSSYS